MMNLDYTYNMDFKDGQKLLDDESIDLVFTDPPYQKQYIYTYQYLADYCPRIMRRGASLMTIVGHYELEMVMDMFRGKLKYRWINAMIQTKGHHARMLMGIEVMWKPILWYVKGAYPMGRGFLCDAVDVSGPEGQSKPSGHKWQQAINWASYYIQRTTKENDIVLDPYMGSGTVAEACIRLNRRFIGFDIDKESCDMSNERTEECKCQIL